MKPETDKEALFAVAQGAGIIVLTMGIFIGIILLTSSKKPWPMEKFMVVDEYNGCQVVRYLPKDDAVAAYFLDCRTFGPAPDSTLTRSPE